MRLQIGICLLAVGLLSLGLLASDGETEYTYAKGCELCPALAEAHRTGVLEVQTWPDGLDLAAVLTMAEEQLDTAILVAWVHIYPQKYANLGGIRLAAGRLAELLLEFPDEAVWPGLQLDQGLVLPHYVDSLEFLLAAMNPENQYVRDSLGLDDWQPYQGQLHYEGVYQAIMAYFDLARAALLDGFRAWDARDEAAGLDAMNRVYAALLAVQGQTSAWRGAGLRTLMSFVDAREATVRVGESIQEAIDRLDWGGTLVLEPGIYRESVVIDKSINIIGASIGDAGAGPITIIEGISGESALLVQPPARRSDQAARRPEQQWAHVDISGIGFRVESHVVETGTSQRTATNGVVAVWGRSKLTLDGCRISHGAVSGLVLIGELEATITKSSIEGSGEPMAFMEYSFGEPVPVSLGEYPGRIDGCGNTIEGLSDGYEFLLEPCP